MSKLLDIAFIYDKKIGIISENPESNHQSQKKALHHDLVFENDKELVPLEIKYIRHQLSDNFLANIFKQPDEIVITKDRFWGVKGINDSQCCGDKESESQCEGQLLTDIIRIIKSLKFNEITKKYTTGKIAHIFNNGEVKNYLIEKFYPFLFKNESGSIYIENKDPKSKYDIWYQLKWSKKFGIIKILEPNELKDFKFTFNFADHKHVVELTVKAV